MFVVLAAIAFVINCAFWDLSGGRLNNFFVGPQISTLIVFKQIGEAYGWYVSTALYIPATCFAAWIVFMIIKLIRTHSQKRKANSQ